jgi:hypothetical protein
MKFEERPNECFFLEEYVDQKYLTFWVFLLNCDLLDLRKNHQHLRR